MGSTSLIPTEKIIERLRYKILGGLTNKYQKCIAQWPSDYILVCFIHL